MKIIGITGSSGSGKTTVCKKIKEYLNAEIIDADKIAKEILEENPNYLQEIVKEFGQDILNSDNTLNRRGLANIIYNDFNSKEKLDKITFRFVCKKIEQEINDLMQNFNIKYVLVDAPLLLEAGLNKICDYVISVIADMNLKIDRICLRDDVTSEIAIKRLNIQKTDEFYISNSDFVIENNGNDVDNKIKEICNSIMGG